MPPMKKRVPTIVKITLILLIPILIATTAFCWVGVFLIDDERIYPNISIAGIDVSGMTKEEAIQALNLSEFEEHVKNTIVTIEFPDYSELIIAGRDIHLANDALLIVESAFSFGRGQGFIKDTINYIRQNNMNEQMRFDVFTLYDIDALNTLVSAFTENYNRRLAAAEPIIYRDRIIITKGAGQELADVMILKDLAYIGLFESFETGNPVKVVYTLPETEADTAQLENIHNKLFVAVESAVIDLSTFEVSDSTIGVDFDLHRAVDKINETESGKTVTIFMRYIRPETTREDLEGILFRDLIGEQTTRVGGVPDRVRNVTLSAETINGLVLLPGDEFSFNDVVGIRTLGRGYRPGGAYIGGELVETIGGGVCQTVSTLYSAIMDSELLITERHRHSQEVPYISRGRDATVAWDTNKDFRFVNNTDYPIRIDFEYADRNLTARVYGTIVDEFPELSFPFDAV